MDMGPVNFISKYVDVIIYGAIETDFKFNLQAT